MIIDPRLNRLKADYEKLKELENRSPFVKILQMAGNPPSEYTFLLACKGITKLSGNGPVFSEQHRLKIVLSPDYPRVQPQLAMLSPIFHPNFKDQTICIGHSYSPSMGLDDLVVVIIQMIRYENYNPISAYNHQAVEWAKNNRNLIPLDKRQIVQEDVQFRILNDISIVDSSDDLLGQIQIL